MTHDEIDYGAALIKAGDVSGLLQYARMKMPHSPHARLEKRVRTFATHGHTDAAVAFWQAYARDYAPPMSKLRVANVALLLVHLTWQTALVIGLVHLLRGSCS